MVFASPSVSIFLFLLIVLLVFLFFNNFAKNYLSDITYFDHIQSQNKVDEKGKFLFPMESCDGFEISFIYQIDGMNTEEIENFKLAYANLTKEFNGTRFEVFLVIHSSEGKYLRTLVDFINKNPLIQRIAGRDNEVMDFIAAATRARGKLIVKHEYKDYIKKILPNKMKPIVVFAQPEFREQFPGFTPSDFADLAMCSKIGFMTAFSRLHSTSYGSNYELKQLCQHYHVDIIYIKTGAVIEVDLSDVFLYIMYGFIVDVLYLTHFYKKDKKMKIKQN